MQGGRGKFSRVEELSGNLIRQSAIDFAAIPNEIISVHRETGRPEGINLALLPQLGLASYLITFTNQKNCLSKIVLL